MAYEFQCADAGATGCRWKARGSSEEDLAKVEGHAKKAHKVEMPTETIRSYLRSTIRSS